MYSQTFSYEKLDEVAESILNILIENDLNLITMTGQLGAGKTALTKSIGKKIGVDDTITSPTFNLLNEYESSHSRFKQLNHIDLYRLDDLGNADFLELSLKQSSKDNLTVIEWPEKIQNQINSPYLSVNLEISENKRIITAEVK